VVLLSYRQDNILNQITVASFPIHYSQLFTHSTLQLFALLANYEAPDHDIFRLPLLHLSQVQIKLKSTYLNKAKSHGCQQNAEFVGNIFV
jgi:hypothetical protein